MNPQKGHRSDNVDKREWSFVECERIYCATISSGRLISFKFVYLAALIARHAPEVGPSPMRIKCPSCSKQILTQIETETYSKTHFCAAALIMTIV